MTSDIHLDSVVPGTLEDRAIGALIGLATCDAVGTTLEFERRDSYPPLTDMIGGGPFRLPAGTWTDDTSMALALAESLIQCGGLDPRDLMSRLVNWWRWGEYSATGECSTLALRRALRSIGSNGTAIRSRDRRIRKKRATDR
ncbi:ADP-ribosylglycohydrolase family protein [Flavisphingomonas formosensis]|uniref:ADP-ribosylglycohydrolase family protein n=1 Tax=Flavisphingomonas formosensis TaxID=861534 RepID=UPI0022B7561B|nr:ADP-ribosylglycohydrolase family protein [Sphingomonas formosensis]